MSTLIQIISRKRPKWKLTDLGNNALKSSYSLEIIE